MCNLGKAILAVVFVSVVMSCKNDRPAYEKAFGINPGRPIHFVVPVGFRGAIQIVEDKDNGMDLPRDGDRLLVKVPANGRVVVRSFEPFEREHRESASHADGTKIPLPEEYLHEFPRDRVLFFGGGTSRGGKYSQETVVYFVGTKEELQNVK